MKWKSRTARSIGKRGFAETFLLAVKSGALYMSRLIVRWFTWNPFNPWRQCLDRRYDRRFGVDTAGIDWIPEMSVKSVNAYSPVPQSTFNKIMRHLELDHSK